MQPVGAEILEAGTKDLLSWVDARPRTYAETMDAWRTHCPRLSIWEDAVAAGFVAVVRDGRGSSVALTSRGRVALDHALAR
jgi:hypothetical protein